MGTERAEADKDSLAWLVIGHPRSGTGTAAKVFQKCEVDVGHEYSGAGGISSWMYAVASDKVPFHPEDENRGRNHYTFESVIWIVRHPRDLFSSVVETECRVGVALNGHRWRARHVDIDLSAPIPVQAAQSILGWSELCRSQADYTLRVERAHLTIPALLGLSPLDPVRENKRSHREWSWSEIEDALPDQLYRALQQLSIFWGYRPLQEGTSGLLNRQSSSEEG